MDELPQMFIALTVKARQVTISFDPVKKKAEKKAREKVPDCESLYMASLVDQPKMVRGRIFQWLHENDVLGAEAIEVDNRICKAVHDLPDTR